ncbi:MAG: glycosyltransferase family 4 protein [Bacteroidota bacterium]
MSTHRSASPRVLVALGNLALNGQERGNIEVYRALHRDGVQACFATHTAWGDRAIQPYLDTLGLAWAPVPYARHFTKRLGVRGALRNLKQVRAASQAFAEIAGSFRPTHIHLANPHYALNVLPVLRATGAAVIYRMGDAPTLHHAVYRQLWQRGIVPRVDRFVCNSEYVRVTALASGVPEEKTTVILSTPPRRSEIARSDLPDDLRAERVGEAAPFAGHTVVYMGQLSEHKGVGALVDAAIAMCRQRDEVRFLLAGIPPGGSGHASAWVKRVLVSGFGDRIRFLGYIEDIPGLLELADVHTAPSLWEEPLANTVLEAKRAGVPTVLFPSGGLPELVVEQGQDAYLCPDKSSDALATGLAHYLDMDTDALASAGSAAARSLGHLGCDEATFRASWLRVLADTMPS